MAGGVRLDMRAQVRRSTHVDDGFSATDQWGDHGDPIWAGRVDVSDAERARASEVSAQLSVRFLVRTSPFTKTIKAADRLVVDGEVFEITGAKASRKRGFRELSCAVRSDAI